MLAWAATDMQPAEFGYVLGCRVKQAGGFAAGGKMLGSALGAAAKAKPVAQGAVNAYRAVNTPLLSHATKALPQAAQPVARRAVQAAGGALTANTAYQTYNAAADATAGAAQNVARNIGVTDQKVLDDVGSRARSQMIPMAYRAVAPMWAGGDNTPVGQELSKDLGTVAYHNITPAVLNPSQRAVNWTPAERTMHAALGNPVGAVSSAIFPARPSAQQMWQNVPQAQRSQITQNALQATQNAGNSPIAKGMQHIFQPAIDHQTQQLNSALGSLLPR